MRFHQPRLGGDASEFPVGSAAPFELFAVGSVTVSALLFAAATTGAFSLSLELDGADGCVDVALLALASTKASPLLPFAVWSLAAFSSAASEFGVRGLRRLPPRLPRLRRRGAACSPVASPSVSDPSAGEASALCT